MKTLFIGGGQALGFRVDYVRVMHPCGRTLR